MQFHIISLFPEVCQAYLEAGVLGRAQKTDKGKGAKVRGKKMEVAYYNPRAYTTDKHRKVDERPYGGGAYHSSMGEGGRTKDCSDKSREGKDTYYVSTRDGLYSGFGQGVCGQVRAFGAYLWTV